MDPPPLADRLTLLVDPGPSIETERRRSRTGRMRDAQSRSASPPRDAWRAASPGGRGGSLASSAGAPAAELPGDYDRRRPRADSEPAQDVLLVPLSGLERDQQLVEISLGEAPMAIRSSTSDSRALSGPLGGRAPASLRASTRCRSIRSARRRPMAGRGRQPAALTDHRSLALLRGAGGADDANVRVSDRLVGAGARVGPTGRAYVRPRAVLRVSAVVAFEHPPRFAVHIPRRGTQWQQEP